MEELGRVERHVQSELAERAPKYWSLISSRFRATALSARVWRGFWYI